MKFKALLITLGAALLLAMFLSAGCSGILLHHAMDQGQALSAEQVDAYNRVGAAVYGCFALAGPPPAGSTVWIIVPKGSPVNFAFTDNCHLLNR